MSKTGGSISENVRSNILLSYPVLLTINWISSSHSSINSANPFSDVILVLSIIPVLSEIDVVANDIDSFVLESRILVVNRMSHRGNNFFTA